MLQASGRLRVLASHVGSQLHASAQSGGPGARRLSRIPLLEQAASHPRSRVAVVDSDGTEHTYGSLNDRSVAGAAHLQRAVPNGVAGRQVAFIANPSSYYVGAQWAIWRAGGVGVPLCVSHPPSEAEFVVSDSESVAVCSTADFGEAAARLAERAGVPHVSIEAILDGEVGQDPAAEVDLEQGALIVYTSGTTGRPKGVLTSHRALTAQVQDLVTAWRWTPEDVILHFLPLHHVHGIVNKLCCAMWAGARVEFTPFSPAAVWKRLADQRRALSLFMAVPTIYAKMIEWYEAVEDPSERERMREGCRRLRLMVSGSAALPKPVMDRWHEITGHVLLERYGMTEFGMALSNPYEPESARIPGSVGLPLPSVTVRVVDETTGAEVAPGESGELRVRGANLFTRYLNRPEASASAFDRNGYFCTGDTACFDTEIGAYRILGRSSVDILKTGGYKVSALEVERTLLAHPAVAEAVVLGVPDVTWGDRVVALVRRSQTAGAEAESNHSLLSWTRERLASYKVPREMRFVRDVPKNAMGKVNKKALVQCDPGSHSGRLAPIVDELAE